MSVLKGDFIGFTFNNVHSSDLGLVRTSGGNRYDENLLPSFSDKTQQADGMNGVYYFGTNYNQKDLSVPVAYDSVTEEQKRKIIMLFGENTVCPLIFDETPYKVYYAKISNPPSLSFICFDDKHGERVYKGEGVINFTVHSFAKSRYKYLEEKFTEIEVNENEVKSTVTKMNET